MPKNERIKTKYPGVFYVIGKGARGRERIYYIIYRRNGELIEEKAGRQFQDDMTPGRAAGIRARRIDGKELSNVQRREAEKAAEDGRWTFTRLWEQYKQGRPDNKTLQVDGGRFKKYIQPHLGDKVPAEIDSLSIDRLKHRHLKDLSLMSQKHVLQLIKRIVNFGLGKGLCSALPFKIESVKVDNERTEFITDEQAKNLLEVIGEWPDRQTANMVLLAFLTGMRRGELYKLQWRDVDFDHGFIYIRDPKGGKSQHIPLNPGAKELLEKHPRIGGEFVFSHDDGKPFTDRAHNHKRLRTLRKAIGLPDDFRPLHGLRHSYASMLASQGVDLYVVQKLLTHKSPLMTQRYAHLRDEALRKASNLAGEIISGAIGETGKKKVVKK